MATKPQIAPPATKPGTTLLAPAGDAVPELRTKMPGPRCPDRGRLQEYLQRCVEKQERAFTRAYKRCWKKFSEKSVHQLRVESRRLLALLDLLETVLPDENCR